MMKYLIGLGPELGLNLKTFVPFEPIYVDCKTRHCFTFDHLANDEHLSKPRSSGLSFIAKANRSLNLRLKSAFDPETIQQIGSGNG